MSVRNFRHRVQIQTQTAGSTSAGSRGQKQKTWETVAIGQASIKQLTGEEAVVAKQLDARATHDVEMYYNSKVTETARLMFC